MYIALLDNSTQNFSGVAISTTLLQSLSHFSNNSHICLLALSYPITCLLQPLTNDPLLSGNVSPKFLTIQLYHSVVRLPNILSDILLDWYGLLDTQSSLSKLQTMNLAYFIFSSYFHFSFIFIFKVRRYSMMSHIIQHVHYIVFKIGQMQYYTDYQLSI